MTSFLCTIALVQAISLSDLRTHVVVLGNGAPRSRASLILYDSSGVQTLVRHRALPARGRVFKLRLAPSAYRVYGTVETGSEACGDHLDVVVP